MNENNRIIAIEYSLQNPGLSREWTYKEAMQLNTNTTGLNGFYNYVKNNNNKTCKIVLLNP